MRSEDRGRASRCVSVARANKADSNRPFNERVAKIHRRIQEFSDGSCLRRQQSLDNFNGNHVSGTRLMQRKTGGDGDKIAAFDEAQLD
jgi:hypothetical protein